MDEMNRKARMVLRVGKGETRGSLSMECMVAIRIILTIAADES